MNNESNGVNTLLLVVVLILIVGAGVWYFTTHKVQNESPKNTSGVNIELK